MFAKMRLKESTAPTVAVSATALESNTIELYNSLNGKVVDEYTIGAYEK